MILICLWPREGLFFVVEHWHLCAPMHVFLRDRPFALSAVRSFKGMLAQNLVMLPVRSILGGQLLPPTFLGSFMELRRLFAFYWESFSWGVVAIMGRQTANMPVFLSGVIANLIHKLCKLFSLSFTCSLWFCSLSPTLFLILLGMPTTSVSLSWSRLFWWVVIALILCFLFSRVSFIKRMVALWKSGVRINIIGERFRVLGHRWNASTIINAWRSIRKDALTVIFEWVSPFIEVHVKSLRNITESHRFNRLVEWVFFRNEPRWFLSPVSSFHRSRSFSLSTLIVKLINHLLWLLCR